MAGYMCDLQALVNGYSARMTTGVTPSATVTTTTAPAENCSFNHLSSLRVNENEVNPFSFPDFSFRNPPRAISLYRELEEIYKPFYQPYINSTINNNTSTTTILPPPPPQITPIPPIPNFANFPNYPYLDTLQQELEQKPLLQPQPQPLPPPPPPPLPPPPQPRPEQQVQAQGEAELQAQPEQQQAQAQPRARGRAASGSSSRRRKSLGKMKKMCEVSAEKLFDDLWAWRKYGQKPIKGSPYPRNYYRCSSSKGCSARKQVEKSSNGVDMFTVTFTGEHTHPRPPHRNSLAGNSRNKFPSVSINNRNRNNNNNANVNITSNNNSNVVINNANAFVQENDNFVNDPVMNAFAASYAYSPTSLSPNTPLIASSSHEEHMVQQQTEIEEPIVEGELTLDELEEFLEEDDEEEDDEMVMIPNMAMNEDLFMGFQELGRPIPSNWGNSFNPPSFGTGGSGGNGGGYGSDG